MAKAKTPTTKTAAKKATQSKRRTAKTSESSKSEGGKSEVVMDRRRENRRGKSTAESKGPEPKVAEKPAMERRAKVNRRRQIDPTTCERDYSNDEIEFMQALDAYKRANGRMFPTCSEILEVVRGLGYQRGPAQESDSPAAAEQPEANASVPAITDELPAS